MTMKQKIRNSKSEARNNFKTLMFKTLKQIFCFFWISVIWICFGFRYSDFGFKCIDNES
jgi:hypothetical protein